MDDRTGSTAPRPRANILLIMVDQLAAKWLEAAIAGAAQLPNISALVARGVTFRKAFSTNPVCCPARASIATGLPSQSHGVTACGFALDPALPTFMQALQRAGWRTGLFGKAHFRPQLDEDIPDYRPYGFDIADTTEDDRVGPWLDWIANEHPEHLEAALATCWMAGVQGWHAKLSTGLDLTERIRSIRARFPWSTEDDPAGTAEAYLLPFPAEYSQTEWITRRAVRFIEMTASDEAFFAQVSYVQPHGPSSPPASCLASVDEARIPRPVPAEWRDDAASPTQFADDAASAEEDWAHARRLYFADLVHLDTQVGRLIKCLVQEGRFDSTYVIFLSDHGELLGDHGFTGKWERHYDACIRVPLILAGPQINGGSVRDQLVDLLDIAPTVLDMAGIDAPRTPVLVEGRPEPAGVQYALPGRTLLDLAARAHTRPWRDELVIESNNNRHRFPPNVWARTLRTSRYRFTVWGNGGEQLFDLSSDPDEQRNLVRDQAYAALREELRSRLLLAVVRHETVGSPRDAFAGGAW